MHYFRDEGIRNPAAPYDHVVIFDEAQRAWDRKKTADFMKRRKKIPDFPESESEFLISYLNRHSEWAVIDALPRLRAAGPVTAVVFYVGHVDRAAGVPAGSFGITNRPDELLHLVMDALERCRL